uniref:Ion transport domain-containing protein n=1 Tax=Anguilla anguilla TaxID=7936 RepID=A0A0E9WGL1_ANGAN
MVTVLECYRNYVFLLANLEVSSTIGSLSRFPMLFFPIGILFLQNIMSVVGVVLGELRVLFYKINYTN